MIYISPQAHVGNYTLTLFLKDNNEEGSQNITYVIDIEIEDTTIVHYTEEATVDGLPFLLI